MLINSSMFVQFEPFALAQRHIGPKDTPELIDTIAKIIKALQWGQATGVAISKGAPAPASSLLGGWVSTGLEKAKANIDLLQPPPVMVSLPSFAERVPTRDTGELRSYLSERETAIQNASFKYIEDRDDYISNLEDMVAAIDELSQMRDETQKTLELVVGLDALPDVSHQVIYTWFDIVTRVQDQVSACNTAAVAKVKDGKREFDKRKADIQASGNALLNLLALEKSGLLGDAATIAQLAAAVDKHRKSYDAEQIALDEIKFEIDTREGEIIELRDTIASSEKDAVDLSVQRNDHESKLRELDVWLSSWKSTWKCSKGFGYYQCTDHNNEKIQFEQTAVKNFTIQRGQVYDQLARLKAKEAAIASDIANDKSELLKKRARLANDRSVFDRRTTSHTADLSFLREEQARYEELKYSSKADIYLTANEQSTSSITTLRGQLK